MWLLRLDGRFVDQHNWNVVLHRVDAMTRGALQGLGILAVVERLLAGGANKDFEKVFSKHAGILRQLIHHGGTESPRNGKTTVRESFALSVTPCLRGERIR